jgi:hypothetical protein
MKSEDVHDMADRFKELPQHDEYVRLTGEEGCVEDFEEEEVL